MIFSERQRKIFKWVGYPIFALFCFLFFMVTTLPYDKMQDKLIGYARDNLKLNVEIEELSGAFPLGIVARGVTLDSDVDREKRGLPIEIDYLKIKAGLLSSLLGWNKMSVSAEIFGGEIDGTVAVNSSGEQVKVDMEISELQLEKIAYFKSMFPDLPMKGELSSEIELDWNSKQVKESKGSISFEIGKGSIGPGKWQVDLPQIRTGDLEVQFSIADGKMIVDKYVHSSPDIQSDMNGDFILSNSPGQWRPNINYRFKLDENLVNKNEIFKLGLSIIQDAKGKGDFYYFSLRGTMQMPRWQPNRGLAAAFDKTAAKQGETKADKKEAQKRPAATRPDKAKAGSAASKAAARTSRANARTVPPRKPVLKDRARPGQAGKASPDVEEAERPQEETAPQPEPEEEAAPEPVEEEEVVEEEEAADEVHEEDTNGEENDSQAGEENPAEDKAEEEE